MLAVIMATDDPDRLRVAISLLVSTAVEGEPAFGLVSVPVAIEEKVEPDLWATVAETGVRLYACDPGPFEVMSMPRFLKHTAGARLVVV
jgi:hypothetical protein